MSGLVLLTDPDAPARSERARRFCAEFGSGARPRYVLGRNVYAESVARHVDVTGFIDDTADGTTYLGKPTVKAERVPRDALVLNASGGRPFTAHRRLEGLGLESLDYFAYFQHAGLPLRPMVFNEGFAEDFAAHRAEYEWVFGLLRDAASRQIFRKLVSFRLTYQLALLEGFTSREDAQYFEDFLRLEPDGETFVDVGGFNGSNSLHFIRLCPGYKAVHVFEPEPLNYQRCVAALTGHRDVHHHQIGLSNARRTLRLEPRGSASRISEQGPLAITVDRLDHLLEDVPTFVKMDIEGAERAALEGAQGIVARHGPRLAIAVYHGAGDFWRIPRQVLALHSDYDIYLRHYTETIYETVMFFVPRRRIVT